MGHSIDWLSLGIRWFHVMAGITWIGNSFFFMWLDGHLRPPKSPDKTRVDGELWMVHSGGFYLVEKSRIAPGRVPNPLYWFKWETTATLITGLFLLFVTYYANGGIYLLKADGTGLPWASAVSVSLGILVGSWFIYDMLWNAKISQRTPIIGHLATVGILVGMVWLYCYFLGGRAAFVHIGATMGTVMTANVWMRILPGQKKMIEAAEAGQEPDFAHGKRAKHRSIHNSYMTLPVILMMISNHYPQLYSTQASWIIVLLIVVLGGSLRHYMLSRHEDKQTYRPLLLSALAGFLVIYLAESSPATTGRPVPENSARISKSVSSDRVMTIIHQRCTPCHSETPQEPGLAQAPLGIHLDSLTEVHRFSDRIMERAVVTKTMPPGNKTGITSLEVEELSNWIQAQRPQLNKDKVDGGSEN